MKYYVAKGPIPNLGYKWYLSYYKTSSIDVEVTRFYSNGHIVKTTFGNLNPIFISKYCKEITKEEYESMLEL